MDGLRELYYFRLEVGLEVWDRCASQPAGSLGDLGQSFLVLFFEAAEVTEAVECHHRLHCGPVKQLQQRAADAERLIDHEPAYTPLPPPPHPPPGGGGGGDFTTW